MAYPICVTQIMQSPVETVGPDTTAATAAATCERAEIGSVVVVDDGHPVGIATSADFVRLLGSSSNPEDRPVAAFMSSPVITVPAGESLRDAVERMRDRGISRLVATVDGEIAGIISTDDVAAIVPQLLFERDRGAVDGEHRYRTDPALSYDHSDWEAECICAAETSVTVGDTVRFSKTITEGDVRTFAAASGDTNRLHLEEEYASETRFGRRIVHGTLVGSLISAALARLPGVTIYVSQDLSFLAPLGIGQRATARCQVSRDLGDDRFTLTTDVVDEDETTIIEGQAVVLIDPEPQSLPEATITEGA